MWIGVAVQKVSIWRPTRDKSNIANRIKRGQNMSFALKARQTFGIESKRGGKQLDGNAAAQLRVSGLVNLAHTARSDMTRDLVMCEFGSDHGVVKSGADFIK